MCGAADYYDNDVNDYDDDGDDDDDEDDDADDDDVDDNLYTMGIFNNALIHIHIKCH